MSNEFTTIFTLLGVLTFGWMVGALAYFVIDCVSQRQK